MMNPSGGGISAHTYDKADRLTTLAESTRTTTYAYRADSSLQTVTLPNATTANYAYDNARRLTQLTNASSTLLFDAHRYTLDAVGNRTRVDEVLAQLGALGPQSWGDDASGELGDDAILADKHAAEKTRERSTGRVTASRP